jgi:hypothetical protein
MFNVARTKPAPEVGRGLFESGGSRIATSDPPDVIASSQDALAILTRRANHRHSFIIARILEPAPGNWPRAF